MERKEIIGELIKKEVDRQDLSVPDFANKISCNRNNAYHIFKRSDIGVELLEHISRKLKYNFFKDLADNMELTIMDKQEKEKEIWNKDAVAQFHDVIIDVLERLDIEPVISFGRPKGFDKSIILPDFMIEIDKEYSITFTIGENIYDKAKSTYQKFMSCQTFTNEAGKSVDLLTNKSNNIHWIDIKLDFKTAEEWEDILRFALEKVYKK